MTVVVDDLDAIDLVSLNAWTSIPQWPQANGMSNNVETFSPLSLFNQCWTNRDCTAHDAVGEIRVRQCVPIVFLIGAPENGAATYDYQLLVIEIWDVVNGYLLHES